MKIHLSFDYELFFGAHSGSIQKCMIEPTNQLREISKKYKVPFVFFVDAGYLVALKRHADIEKCKNDYEAVASQIKVLHEEGHEIALHVHPHWEDSHFVNGEWQINTKRYKLADFNKEDAHSIISKYHSALKEITGTACKSYRAGGWCIQPFEHIKEVLQKEGILIDSSVYPGGFHDSSAHSYDFRTAPIKAEWQFEKDCCTEVQNGSFKEIAITSDIIEPFFYWNLYFKMKSQPSYFKPIGDGSWLKDKKKIYKQFYSSTNHFACADGYFASRLKSILKRLERKNENRMMVLSHPKSLALCSFVLLEEFIVHAKKNTHEFVTLKQ